MHGRWGALPGGVLVAALLALPLATPAQATFSGANGRIAFERDGGIWTIRPDGTDPAIVAVAGSNPSWSADGRHIAYDQGGAILVADVSDTGRPQGTRNLTSGHATGGAREDAAFLPTGQLVYLERRVSPTNTWHLWRMEADGSGPVDLTPGWAEALFDPATNSAGTIVVFAGPDKNIYSVSGGTLSPVTNFPFPESEGWPSLGPDGTVLYSRSGVNANAGLWTSAGTRLAGGPSDPNGQSGAGSWSPDGTKIAYLSSGGTSLWTMNADGGAKVQITGSPTGNLFFADQPDWGPAPSGSTPQTPTQGSGAPAGGGSTPAPAPAAKPSAPVRLAAAKLTGTAKVGRKLRCRPARFTGATKVATSWLRAGRAIKGATKPTYTPSRKDVGRRIACRSTGTGAGGRTVSTSSAVLVRR